MTKLTVIDCETTGTEPTDRVVEVAAMSLHVADGTPVYPVTFSTLVNPGIPIPPVACAVHHIVDADVADAPALNVALAALDATMGVKPEAYVAHNAKFDRQFLGALGDRWICTYKCAMRQWPDAPGHSNQVLRYWLGLESPPAVAGHPHRAMHDVWVTARILLALKDAGWTVERMLQVSAEPILLSCFRFGKHANVPLAQVPADYLSWMLRQDFDEDVVFTCRTELARRHA